MADKETKLSIVIRTVDKATAGIKAISARLDAATKPIRDFKDALSDLRSKSGLDEVAGGFKGVGGAVADLLGKVAMVGGVVGVATAGLMHLVDGFDDLGDKAEELGVGVDWLAQTRFAAENAGAAVETLDGGMKTFAVNLGLAREGTGKLTGFLKQASPALLKQLKATKSNEEAFGLLADAMLKIQDPAKRAAFAQKTLGDASLAPLLAKGSKGIQELRDRYGELAGSQKGAADEAGKVDDSMKELKAATDGVKAALVQGLAPALKVIIDKLRTWFQENRANVAEWAASLGKKIPAAVNTLIDVFHGVVDTIRPFVDSATKLKIIGAALAAVIAGPLVASVVSLGIALLTTPVGWIVAGVAAIAAGAYLLIKNWDAVTGFFVDLWDTVNEKFGWAIGLIDTALTPILFMPRLIIGHWETVKDFFGALWGEITAEFQASWEVIKAIVDKVVGAVETVNDALGFVGGSVGIDGAMDQLRAQQQARGDVTSQARGAIAAARGGSTEARVQVDFANAPPGLRVTTDPKSTAGVDTNLGFRAGAR